MKIVGRPVLLGMNNPLSADPKHALAPYPEQSTGHRLWAMLNEQNGASRRDYMNVFDRREVLESRFWNAKDAAVNAPRLFNELSGREVVVLGHSVKDSLALWTLAIGKPVIEHGILWRFMLDPSSRSRAYYDPEVRVYAMLLLEELYERGKACG